MPENSEKLIAQQLEKIAKANEEYVQKMGEIPASPYELPRTLQAASDPNAIITPDASAEKTSNKDSSLVDQIAQTLSNLITNIVTQVEHRIAKDVLSGPQAAISSAFTPRDATREMVSEQFAAGKPLTQGQITHLYEALKQQEKARAQGVYAANAAMPNVAKDTLEAGYTWATFNAQETSMYTRLTQENNRKLEAIQRNWKTQGE